MKYKYPTFALLVIIGILFIVFSTFLCFREVNKSFRCSVKGTAIVVENRLRYSSSDDFLYFLVLQYTVEDYDYHLILPTGRTSSEYKVGDEIPIRYNWNNPNEFLVEKDIVFTVICGVFGTFGVMFLGVWVFQLKRNIYYGLKFVMSPL